MAEKNISKEEVKKLAILANLDVSGQEEKLAEILSDTLKHMENLNELDTSKTQETYQVTGLTNVFQKEDAKAQTLTKEEALSNAKETRDYAAHKKDGLFATKAVFDR